MHDAAPAPWRSDSVLTPQEAEGLFATLDRIRAEGRAVLYISHKLEEVRRICETATILRHGKVVARCDPRRESAASLATMMVGSEVGSVRHDAAEPTGPVRLAVHALSMPPEEAHGVALRDVSLALHAGRCWASPRRRQRPAELFAVLPRGRRAGRGQWCWTPAVARDIKRPPKRAAFVRRTARTRRAAPVLSRTRWSGPAANGLSRRASSTGGPARLGERGHAPLRSAQGTARPGSPRPLRATSKIRGGRRSCANPRVLWWSDLGVDPARG